MVMAGMPGRGMVRFVLVARSVGAFGAMIGVEWTGEGFGRFHHVQAAPQHCESQ